MSKPILTTTLLMSAGFVRVSRWMLCPKQSLLLESPVLAAPCVYAFVSDEAAKYVGVAARGLAKRCGNYQRPGPTQRTSQRVGALLIAELSQRPHLDIFAVSPPDTMWNDLPVDTCQGLEAGLIKTFALPWNIRGTTAAV